VETSDTDTRPAVEFDHHSPEYARDFIEQYSQLHAKCPMGWSDQYGGYWVATRYNDVAFVARDDETFSSRHDIPNDGKSYTGITLPSPPNRSTPIEMDPPQFPKYRRILNPPFAPAAIERLKPLMREYTTWCLDQKIQSGEIDFVLDLANPVPAMATLVFLGLPIEEWERIATPFHDIVAHPPGSAQYSHAVEGVFENLARCETVIAERKREPRDDLITRLVQAEIEGAPIPDDEIVEICSLVLGGGVDTTTGLIGHALNYLDQHPEVRPRLHDDPAFMASAVEEWLRYYSPTQALARTATRDVEVGGQLVKEGERVLICWAAANHDPDAFDRHDEIVLERFPNRHAAFGLGAHRCLGSNFTRAEITIVLEEVLRRMPDYKLVPGGAVHYEDIGTVNGWARMPATFTPGPRVGDGTLPGV
jgi:cytochrome P450